MGAGIMILNDDAILPAHNATEASYRNRVRVDDLVRLPDGRPGMVTHVELLTRRGGMNVVRFGARPEIRYAKVVSVKPSHPKKRFLGLGKELPSRFADADIDKLEFIASRDEYDGIDPEAL